MQNNPELDGKRLGQITENFIKVSDTLKEAAYQLQVREISDYPLFVLCDEKPEVGKPLFEKGQFDLDYYINFSFLDEFVQRGLVDKEKLESFLGTYKDPEEFACFFVVFKDFINFVYIPYPED